tara:strand:+ start:228 stop:413 length:186 start_codon:yes stop_codon:yes gene_type:complete
LKVADDDHIPEHGTADAVAGSPAKADHAFVTPEGYDYRAASKEAAQLGDAATPSPESVLIE